MAQPDFTDLRLPGRNPFGEEDRRPWYRRRRGDPPLRYTGALAALLAFAGPAVGAQVHGAARFVVTGAIVAVPSSAFDKWWRERRRREEDRLMPELDG